MKYRITVEEDPPEPEPGPRFWRNLILIVAAIPVAILISVMLIWLTL